MQKAKSANKQKLEEDLKDQGVSSECLKVLLKPAKEPKDFFEFIRLHEIEIQKLLNKDIEFPVSNAEPEEADL